jgi:hypothetical protein
MAPEDLLIAFAVAALPVCCLLGGAMVGWLTAGPDRSQPDHPEDDCRM